MFLEETPKFLTEESFKGHLKEEEEKPVKDGQVKILEVWMYSMGSTAEVARLCRLDAETKRAQK